MSLSFIIIFFFLLYHFCYVTLWMLCSDPSWSDISEKCMDIVKTPYYTYQMFKIIFEKDEKNP